MELKTFISQALQDIVGGVDHAQKRIAYGEIVPKRDEKTGEVDVEFELTISSEEKEGEKGRLVVVAAAVGGGAKPPAAGPPAPGAPQPPPPPPNVGKLKFKVPVRLPEERWYHFIYRWGNELRLLFVRRPKGPAKLTATEAAGGESAPPPEPANPSRASQSAEQAQQNKKNKRSYWGLD